MSGTRKKGFQGRARLSPEAIEKLLPLWKDLKKRHCRLNTSELVSFIVCAYVDRCLSESEKKHLRESFFDAKAFLKAALSNNNSDEQIREAMKSVLKKSKRVPRTQAEGVDMGREPSH